MTALAFHPDGRTMASADEDGFVMCWDLSSAKRLASAHKHKAAVWSLAYCQGGGQLLASGTLKTLNSIRLLVMKRVKPYSAASTESSQNLIRLLLISHFKLDSAASNESMLAISVGQ